MAGVDSTGNPPPPFVIEQASAIGECPSEFSIYAPALSFAWLDCLSTVSSGWGVVYGTEVMDLGEDEPVRRVCVQYVRFLHHQLWLVEGEDLHSLIAQDVKRILGGRVKRPNVKLLGLATFGREPPAVDLTHFLSTFGRAVWEEMPPGGMYKGPLLLHLYYSNVGCVMEQRTLLHQLECRYGCPGHCAKSEGGELPLRISNVIDGSGTALCLDHVALASRSINIMSVVGKIVQEGLQMLEDSSELVLEEYVHHQKKGVMYNGDIRAFGPGGAPPSVENDWPGTACDDGTPLQYVQTPPPCIDLSPYFGLAEGGDAW